MRVRVLLKQVCTGKTQRRGYMKIIINCQEYPDFETEKAMLRKALPGVEIVESRTVDEDTFIKEARGAVAALVQYVPITPKVIDALPECLGYVRNGIGYNNLDAEYARKNGKYVANVPDYCIDEVSNHALSMMLALNRKLVLSDKMVKAGNYDFVKIRPAIRLSQSILGIVGLGRIGKMLADKAKPLVKEIVYYDPYIKSHEFARRIDSLENLFEISDNISLHTPLDSETKNMIKRDLLEKMRSHACLINTSRGNIVDEKALYDLLLNKKIGGVGFDVFSDEPIKPDHLLAGFDNVILTSHSAWYSEGSMKEVKISWVKQAIEIAQGKVPANNVYKVEKEKHESPCL